jgi:hypothetical protein
MPWNYRVIKKATKIPGGGIDVTYTIHDVYYDKNLDKPSMGRMSPPSSDNVEDLQGKLERMLEACKKPVIYYDTGEEVN